MNAETFIKGMIKIMRNPNADKYCPLCKGKGSYGVVAIGEYAEELQIIECDCCKERKQVSK